MPAFSSVLGALALTAGVGFGINQLTKDKPVSQPAPQPSTLLTIPDIDPSPTPEKSQELARVEMEKQKRIRALAGGQTLLASEGPLLSSAAGKTLLGS